ncbi:hypothetical protein BSP36_167 [Bacillus phage BSP36]|nr:hypothetical protein BSP36_167 [Bacillus phage BSP36]
MSKFKDVESLLSVLDDWVDRRVKSIEKRLLLIDAPDIPVGQKELEVKILAAVVAEIEGYLRDVIGVDVNDPNCPLQYAKDTINLMLSEIEEYKDLPVEDDEEEQTPAHKKATAMELAIKRRTEGLESVVGTLIAYDSGIKALQKARTKAMTLKDLMPYDTQEIPEELQDIPSRLFTLVSRLDSVIQNSTLLKETDK